MIQPDNLWGEHCVEICVHGLDDKRCGKKEVHLSESRLRIGKRSRGRQARRWRDDIVNTKGNTWSRDARDRDEWKRDAEGYILQWMDRAS
ncbi:endonuclease-reverse transcriptase [Plakobranchus ocellatus]|uniref:Endonuclease-reverse transcriptase n=1 Tax=Plakobranchus ocellatus TaxID=259542 RepID=A0AAV3Y771_9GAST|nr:endonuclease-reverse transcriptase [Plakobranchus ocellatus]